MFSRHDPIPLGPYKLTVIRADDTRNVVGDDSPFGKGVAVFARWDGFEPGRDYESFLRSFAKERLVVTDSKGNRYKPSRPITPAQLYYMQDIGGKDWVVMFEVPKESNGLTFLVENPGPREGQPRLAGVTLGL
jgi:hypothetical protein